MKKMLLVLLLSVIGLGCADVKRYEPHENGQYYLNGQSVVCTVICDTKREVMDLPYIEDLDSLDEYFYSKEKVADEVKNFWVVYYLEQEDEEQPRIAILHYDFYGFVTAYLIY